LSRQSSRGSAASLRSAGLAAPAVHEKAEDATATAAVASLPVAGELRVLALVAEPWQQQQLPQPAAQELERLYVVPKSAKLKSLLLPDRQWALDKVLPERLRGGKWELVFSMQGNGASSLAVRQALGGAVQPLVLALEDASGYQFGGFLPSGLFMNTSSLENGYNEGPLGDGESFVFSFGHKGSPNLRTFAWTGKNRLFRILSLSRGVGMGGGGHGFAWLVDDCLATGCSMRSDTYDNPCLAGSEEFRCVDLAAYRIKMRGTSTRK
jgi:hypothetical protein